MKFCSTCKTYKSESLFKKGGKGCLSCRKINSRWYFKNRDRYRERLKNNSIRWRNKNRDKVLIHYGGNPPKCVCCRENKKEFLAIDHIKGGRGKKRVPNLTGQKLYSWILKNNFPPLFRILCHNCNASYGYYGYCPHNRE